MLVFLTLLMCATKAYRATISPIISAITQVMGHAHIAVLSQYCAAVAAVVAATCAPVAAA